jgi:uncharacterized membrane protein
MAWDVSKAVARKDFLILHVRLCVYVLNLETVPSQKRKKKDEFPFVFLNLFYPSLLQNKMADRARAFSTSTDYQTTCKFWEDFC